MYCRGVFGLLLCLGCHGAKSPAPTQTPAAADLSDERAVTAKPIPKPQVQEQLVMDRTDLIRAAKNESKKRRQYALQKPLRNTLTLRKRLSSLMPADVEYKIVGVELHRNMQLTRLAPGLRRDVARVLTLESGARLMQAIGKNLRQANWTLRAAEGQLEAEHAEQGRLELSIEARADEPVVLSIEFIRTDHSSLEPIWDVFGQHPKWMPVLAALTYVGFEYSRFHGLHFGAGFTDIERVALIYRGEFPEMDLRNALLEIGYQATDSGALRRAEQDHRWSVKVERANPSLATVHIQHRWGDSKAAYRRRLKQHRAQRPKAMSTSRDKNDADAARAKASPSVSPPN